MAKKDVEYRESKAHEKKEKMNAKGIKAIASSDSGIVAKRKRNNGKTTKSVGY